MFRSASSNRRRQQIIDNKVGSSTDALNELKLSKSLEDNIALIQKLFTDVDTVRIRRIENNQQTNLKYAIIYTKGVVDHAVISEHIIKPLMLYKTSASGNGLMDGLINQVIQTDDAEKTNNVKQIVLSISYGDTVLFAEGAAEAIIIATKSFAERAVEEPQGERTLAGPREGFTESLLTNMSLLRRKVRTNELKMKIRVFGRRTQTKVCICYIEGIVNKAILQELYKRLDKIDIDAILDANYITELIRDERWSPFRTTGYTERPDVVVGKLLEGRIAILVDGTPVVLTVPYLFIENFQNSEDYYLNFYYMSFSRLLRMLGFFLTVTVPGLYVAIVAYHHELMPTQLLINIAIERASVPLPAALECLVMLIVFDLLRETGVRMPGNVGQALSIVGALVIGQSAVEAKLVAAPMIIVVALTGITALLVPKLIGPLIYIRFFFLLLASMFGFFGLLLAMTVVVIHVINQRSFGIPVLILADKLPNQEVKDTAFRQPLWQLKMRPRMAANRTRAKDGGNGS